MCTNWSGVTPEKEAPWPLCSPGCDTRVPGSLTRSPHLAWPGSGEGPVGSNLLLPQKAPNFTPDGHAHIHLSASPLQTHRAPSLAQVRCQAPHMLKLRLNLGQPCTSPRNLTLICHQGYLPYSAAPPRQGLSIWVLQASHHFT